MADDRQHDRVSQDEHRELIEYAVANRERIKAVEHELERVREAVHGLRGETAAIRYLADRVGDMASDVHTLTEKVETLARRAVSRPQASTLSVFAQYFSLAVAVIALAIAATR